MKTTTDFHRIAVLVAALCLVATGCGSSKSTSASTTESARPSEPAFVSTSDLATDQCTRAARSGADELAQVASQLGPAVDKRAQVDNEPKMFDVSTAGLEDILRRTHPICVQPISIATAAVATDTPTLSALKARTDAVVAAAAKLPQAPAYNNGDANAFGVGYVAPKSTLIDDAFGEDDVAVATDTDALPAASNDPSTVAGAIRDLLAIASADARVGGDEGLGAAADALRRAEALAQPWNGETPPKLATGEVDPRYARPALVLAPIRYDIESIEHAMPRGTATIATTPAAATSDSTPSPTNAPKVEAKLNEMRIQTKSAIRSFTWDKCTADRSTILRLIDLMRSAQMLGVEDDRDDRVESIQDVAVRKMRDLMNDVEANIRRTNNCDRWMLETKGEITLQDDGTTFRSGLAGQRYLIMSEDGSHLSAVGGSIDSIMWSWSSSGGGMSCGDSGLMRVDADGDVTTPPPAQLDGGAPRTVDLTVRMHSQKMTLPPFDPFCPYVQGRWKDAAAYLFNAVVGDRTANLTLTDGATQHFTHPEPTGGYDVTLKKDNRSKIS